MNASIVCMPPPPTQLLEQFIADLFCPAPDHIQIKGAVGKESYAWHVSTIKGMEAVPNLVRDPCHQLLKPQLMGNK